MSTLLQQYNLATSGNFQHLVRMASLGQAITVMAETGLMRLVVRNKRSDLAISTIADGGSGNLTKFVYAIAATPGFTNTPVDADINSAMISQWSNFAGVTNLDLIL